MKIIVGRQSVVLDDEHARLLAISLKIAADRYAADAKLFEEQPPHVTLAQQFRRQETQAREICRMLAKLGYC